MSAQGRNEGFYVLENFVCEAIHEPTFPLANPANQGRNEGMSIVEEFAFQAGPEASLGATGDSQPHAAIPSELPETAMKSVIDPLASYVSQSRNPRQTLLHAMQLLFAKFHRVDHATVETLEQLVTAVPPESFRRQ